MRLALVISSPYSENTVLPERLVFGDTAQCLATEFGRVGPDITVSRLDANRDLPELLEEMLTSRLETIETLFVHFSGYLGVKSDRGPALLLDGSRLRAFPLSRLCAAIAPAARQTFVLLESVAVVDANQEPASVATSVTRAIQGGTSHISALAGIHKEPGLGRRGTLRLTDLFLLALSSHANRGARAPITADMAVEAMRGESLSMAAMAGVDYLPSRLGFVLLGERHPHLDSDEHEFAVPTLRGDSIPLGRSLVMSPPQPWMQDAAYFPSVPPPRVVQTATSTGSVPGAPKPLSNRPPAPSSIAPPTPQGETSRRPQPTLSGFPTAEPATSVGTAQREPGAPRDETEQQLLTADTRLAAGDCTGALTTYESLLTALDGTEDPRRALLSSRVGDCLGLMGRIAEALFAYEHALDLDPQLDTAFEGACRVYQHTGDKAGLVSTIKRRYAVATELRERLSLLDRMADILLLEIGDYRAGEEVLRQRLELVASDIATLERLVETSDRVRNPSSRLDARERLAHALGEPSERRTTLLAEAARIAGRDLADNKRMLTLLEEAIDLGRDLDVALEAAASLLDPPEEWEALLRLYERALITPEVSESMVAAAFRLFELVEDHIDPSLVSDETIRRLLGLAEQHPSLVSAAVRLGNTRELSVESLIVVQHARFIEPRDPTLLRTLLEHPQASRDLVANASAVLVAIDRAEERECELAQWLDNDGLPTPLRALTAADFEQTLYPVELNPTLTTLLERLLPVLMAASALPNQLPRDVPSIDPNTSTATLARCFLWASRFLGTSVPELFVVPDAPVPIALRAGIRPRFIVLRELMSGCSLPELAFVAARDMASLHSGFAVRGDDPSPEALASLFHVLQVATEQGSRGMRSLGDAEQRLGRRILAQMELSPDLESEMARYRTITGHTMEEHLVDATTWMMAVDCVRLRAALVACGDPTVAARMTEQYPLGSPLSAEQQRDVILSFATCEQYLALRSALGIAVARASIPTLG
jgi:tetratricopeptide (TPR) repeat protein